MAGGAATLIVTCEKCSTQFQLDESRVPDSGIRVRCSLCRHAFFVQHPDGFGDLSADPVTRAVEQVLDGEPPELPVDADLESADLPALPDADDESWEWSDEGPLPAAAEAAPDRFEQSFEAARAAVDDLLGSPDAVPEPEEEPARFPAAAEIEPEPAALGPADSVPQFDLRGPEAPPSLAADPWEAPAWNEDASEAPPDREAISLPGLENEGDALETGHGEALEAAIGAEAAETTGGEAPDPFADDELPSPAEARFARPERLDLEELEAGEPPEALEEPSGLELEEPPDARAGLEEPVPARDVVESPSVGLRLEPQRTRALATALAAALERAGNGLGWSVVVVLTAATLWASVAPRTAPQAGLGAQAVAGLEATAVEGRWVENAIVGPIYVVRGELRNPGAEPKAPGARLVVRMLDAEGAPLDAPGWSLAPPAPSAWLREAHPREFHAAREAAAQHLARTPLAPGAIVPFEAVVESLPDTARRFDLAVAPPAS